MFLCNSGTDLPYWIVTSQKTVMFIDTSSDNHLINNFRYQDAFILLVQEILVKMQFKHNRDQLEELDDESLDDDVSH